MHLKMIHACIRVFPTHVGMFRTYSRPDSKSSSFPHARGDVPDLPPSPSTPHMFSPRTWGCSAAKYRQSYQRTVFPRTGDVPTRSTQARRRRFPHARGCSSILGKPAIQNGFPTHVGMFRRISQRAARKRCFPTHGDVPIKVNKDKGPLFPRTGMFRLICWIP